MAIPKPSTFTEWTVGNPDFANVTQEPTAQEKEDGWGIGTKPPREFMNWIHYNNDQWIKYLESITDELITGTPSFDAIVGSGVGTYADINAAIAAISAGSSIYVRTSQVMDAIQLINKANIRIVFHPSATINRGTSSTGIRIDAAGVFLHMGRFNNFTTGGDIAIDITSNGKNCHILNNRFAIATDTEIADAGSNNVKTGNITEVA